MNMFTNNSVEETLNVPENPFSQERLAGLPGGMTRMGAAIIKGKLDGHAASSANFNTLTPLDTFFRWYCGTPEAVFLERARKKKGFTLL